jgi:uncharacterized protein with FMN-binding domain
MKLAVLPFLAVAACAPAVQINGAVDVLPPECTPAKAAHAEGLLDIGHDATSANAYTVALAVTTPAKDITYDAIEVFYTTDEDRGGQLQLGQVPGTPVNADNAHRTTIGATSTSDIVIAPVITASDATLLQSEPFVADAVSSSNGRARVIANVTLLGKTSGGSAVTSQLFPFPVDLCADCLTTPPTCADASGNAVAPVANPQSCFVGDDVAALVCP